MKNVLSFFNLKSFYRVVISCLAVVFLVINTACSSPEVAATGGLPTGSHPSGQSPDLPNLYDPLTPPQGGMNNYKDVDPRTNTSDANSKADRLINNAEFKQKAGNNPIKAVRKELNKKGLQDRAEDLSDDIGRSAQKKADKVSQGTKRGLDNIQDNTKSFADDVSSGADDLGRNAKGKVEDLKQAVKKTADAVTKG